MHLYVAKLEGKAMRDCHSIRSDSYLWRRRGGAWGGPGTMVGGGRFVSAVFPKLGVGM